MSMKRVQNCCRNYLALLVLSFGMTSPMKSSAGATFIVTSNGDSGPGTLRQAIADSNAVLGSNRIAIGIYGIINLTSGELLVSNSVAILGPAATNLTVQASYSGRV